MRQVLTTILILLLLPSGAVVSQVSAQAPPSTPAASPVATDGAWQVTETREIDVDGEPIALSPDGQWLAGTADDGNAVCTWDIETLTPTCADVDVPVEPYYGNTGMRWAPDSSAFAFVEGSMARMALGDVQVFDVSTDELTNLTGTGGEAGGPLYLGAAWTSDSQQVIFGVNHGLGEGSAPDEVVRVDRSGGELVGLPLPEWSETYDILFPPLVAGEDVFVAIDSESAIDGVWRLGLGDADPTQVVSSEGDPPVDFPLVVSGSHDGRYLNVVSVTGLQRLVLEDTFFILDTGAGTLTPLVSEDSLQLIAFAPEGDIGLMVQDVDGENRLHTLDVSTGEVTPVANSPDVAIWLQHIPVWASNGTAFLPGDGMLITLSPAA